MRTWILCIVLLLTASGCQQERHVRLATTTSVDNSGLLETLLAEYEKTNHTQVDALAVGSGRAIQLLKRGDADLMLTHDPIGEQRFLDDHDPPLYRKLMCSDFIIVGPPGDPTGSAPANSVGEAMTRIAANASFVSRGDRSGTHVREEQLWNLAGVRPAPAQLLESGQGMAATLRITSEREAYSLTDRPTYLKLRDSLDLAVAYEGPDSELLNCYAVTVPRGPRFEEALALAEWMSRGGGRELIETFSIDGEQVFRLWPAGSPDDQPGALPR